MVWLREFVACAARYRGVVTLMVAAIEDPGSALHASCVAMKASGGRLLAQAQEVGSARGDLDVADLFALAGALAWLSDQASLADRTDHPFDVIADAILVPTMIRR